MGDIDFDELDKAVNSVMKQTTGSQPAADDTAVEQQSGSDAPDNTATPTPTEAEQPQPTDQGNTETPQESAELVPEPTPVPEPSTSLTSTNDTASADTPSLAPEESSTEADIPSDSATPPTEQEPTPEAPAEDVNAASTMPQTENAPSVEAKPVKRSGRFMDVVHPSSDMATASNVPDTSPATDRKGATITPPSQPASTESTTVNSAEQAPTPKAPTTPPDTPEPKSPFLPDAKVEKRPLGPITADASLTGSDQDASQQVGTAPNESSGDAPASGPLPDELKGELVSLDAAEHAQPMQAASTQPAVSSDQFQAPGQTAEQPEDEHAAIFSPDAHAPLAHPKKKRSSIAIIATIVGLILVGVIGATALFMFNVL